MAKAARVVICVFDGLRPDMVTPERMPRLAAFAADNTWFREARSVFPSMTRVATTSIATGAPPADHGIVGNAFYFPEAMPEHAIDTSLFDDIQLAEKRLGRSLYEAPTFADALAEAGKTLAVVHTGSAGSAYALNPRAHEHAGHWTFSALGAAHTLTPTAVEEAVVRFGPLPERELPRFNEVAYAARVLSELVLAERKPDVAMVWFNEPDTSYHYKFLGAPETAAVMLAADRAFGEIMDFVNSQPDAADTAIIVASDHGQISSSGLFDMAAALTAAGHPARKASERTLEGAKVAITGGNMGEIRVLDGDMERRDAIARWLMTRDEVGMVFTPSEDLVQGAVEGTLSTALLSVDHPRQAELFYIMRSDASADAFGLPGLGLITSGVPVGGGMHGGLNRHELNTVLVLGGAASRGAMLSSTPCAITDIGPTVLDLLGLPPLPTMRGASLLAVDPADKGECATVAAQSGDFRQTLTLLKRGERFFPGHGQRVAV
ncbi:MAG: alkaline phosphatase family protein [Beijerinckiaceae bacterium]